MIKVKYNPNVPEQDHHEFTYEDGHKFPKHDNGLRYAYIDKHGLFHVSKWEDDASKYGAGVYAVTDEMKCKNGLPYINGETYKVWGADECSVKLSSKGEERFYIKNKVNDNKVVVTSKGPRKMAAYSAIHNIYIMIKAKSKEIKAE